MDPLSITASVIACYQLTSVIGALCFRYIKGVRHADEDGDLVLAQIEIFKEQLRHLQQMLADEKSLSNTNNRLHLLESILDGHSASLKVCSSQLKKIQAKLERARAEEGVKAALHRIQWPLKQEDVDQTMKILQSFADAIERALNIDTNEMV